MPTSPHKESHLPVLSKEVLDCLDPKPGESYLDLTAGYGGHAEAILAATGSSGKSLLVDRDEQAIKVLKRKFPHSQIRHSDFLAACQELVDQKERFDTILADLGVSSPHFDQPSRGFAFSSDGPLDMRMDQRQTLSAQEIVNDWPEASLTETIRGHGEEPQAKRIARAIVQNRPIKTTGQLAEVISSSVGPIRRHGKIHPATKTFQAIRIAVNDELNQLSMSLPLMEQLLAPGGRLAIISFHSLEDRIVKRYFKDRAGERYDAELRLVSKKPLMATTTEIANNPRARSAKLRAVCKIKT